MEPQNTQNTQRAFAGRGDRPRLLWGGLAALAAPRVCSGVRSVGSLTQPMGQRADGGAVGGGVPDFQPVEVAFRRRYELLLGRARGAEQGQRTSIHDPDGVLVLGYAEELG